MDRFFTRLVAVLLSACFLIGLSSCEILQEELPKEIMIDDTFSAEQEKIILAAIEEWNQVGREYLGYDIIIYDGRFSDKNGFSPMEDLDDGFNVMYNIEHSDEYYEYLEYIYIDTSTYGDVHGNPLEDPCVHAYSLRNDILIFDFNLVEELELIDSLDNYPVFFQQTVLHELGHWLGLQHVFDSEGAPVMFPYGDPEEEIEREPPFMTQKDIQGFCLVHDCLKQP